MKNKFISFIGVCTFSFVAIAQQVPSFEKKMYTATDGKLYVQKALPIYVMIGTDPNNKEASAVLKSEKTSNYSNPMYFDSEGMNTVRSPWCVDKTTKQMVYPKQDIIFEVYADSKAPNTRLNWGQANPMFKNDKYYVKQVFEVSLTATDALSGVQKIMVSLNGENYFDYVSAIKLDEEKEYSIKYFAVDNVGNVEEVKTVIVVIDKSSPKTSLDIKGNYSENVVGANTLLVLSVSETSSGVARFSLKLDDGPEKNYVNPINTNLLSQGEHKITYYAEDNVSNVEEPHTFEFYIDKTPPTIMQEVIGKSFMVNGREFSSGRSQLKLTTLDNKAGVKEVYYSINNNEYKLYEKPVLLNATSGNMEIKTYAVDNVNNRSQESGESETTQIPYIDLSGPTLDYSFSGPFFTSTDTIYVSSKTRIMLKAKDAEAGVSKIQFNIDNKDQTEFSSPFSIESEGLHTIVYTGYDNVDNSNTETFFVVVDNSGPDIFSCFSTSSKGKLNDKNLVVYPSHVGLFISAKDNVSGYEKMFYSINGSKEKPFTGYLSNFIRSTSLIVKAYDKLGNESSTEIDFAVKN